MPGREGTDSSAGAQKAEYRAGSSSSSRRGVV